MNKEEDILMAKGALGALVLLNKELAIKNLKKNSEVRIINAAIEAICRDIEKEYGIDRREL